MESVWFELASPSSKAHGSVVCDISVPHRKSCSVVTTRVPTKNKGTVCLRLSWGRLGFHLMWPDRTPSIIMITNQRASTNLCNAERERERDGFTHPEYGATAAASNQRPQTHVVRPCSLSPFLPTLLCRSCCIILGVWVMICFALSYIARSLPPLQS